MDWFYQFPHMDDNALRDPKKVINETWFRRTYHHITPARLRRSHRKLGLR
ncbi:hypothetical protein [Ensifer sp. SSB1]|jgi:hypothetical protein|nr:hypothetical protein [Ensifer sp. SSB1]MBK5571556.1 hypothetical protein [Ensifer sp. SSB1]